MKKTKPVPVSIVGTQNDLYVIIDEVEKISPRSAGLLRQEMTENLDGERKPCVMTNNSGGPFSREWITLSVISGALKAHGTGDFISATPHPLFTNANRNNMGFLAAILRCADICLIEESSGEMSSRCYYPDWEERPEKLLIFSPPV